MHAHIHDRLFDRRRDNVNLRKHARIAACECERIAASASDLGHFGIRVAPKALWLIRIGAYPFAFAFAHAPARSRTLVRIRYVPVREGSKDTFKG